MLEDDLKALRKAIEALTQAIKDSQQLLIANTVVEPAQAPEPEVKAVEPTPAALPPLIAPVDEATHQTMSEPDFRALMLKMSRAGHKDELRAKLAEFNVEKAGDLNGKARESYIDWLITLAERA